MNSHRGTKGDGFADRPRAHCGVGAVADLEGRASHEVIQDALHVLEHLDHRGARGAEENTGDGAGILVQKPDHFFRSRFNLPDTNAYAVGQLFLPADAAIRALVEEHLRGTMRAAGFRILGWRGVPTDNTDLGATALASEPAIQQVLLAHRDGLSGVDLDRELFVLRRRLEHSTAARFPQAADATYICSLDRCRLVYKGLLTNHQLRGYYSDLSAPDFESSLALVHSRFSTNTLGAWPLAHPYRALVHNGEINTYRGNLNRMRAREADIAHPALDAHVDELRPLVTPGLSDTALFDEVLELLGQGGRSLPHALRMMVPEAWQKDPEMSQSLRDWYDYHSLIMEPWDGPALIVATDGEQLAAVLDRNGFRPCRYEITADSRLVLASEAGVLDTPPGRIRERGRLGPGQMLIADPRSGTVREGASVFEDFPARPYGEWLRAHRVTLASDADERFTATEEVPDLNRRQCAAGFTVEDLEHTVRPMVADGADPVGAMGNDTPPGTLRRNVGRLPDYFRQLFAQVSNPAIDYLREDRVTTLVTHIGPAHNLLADGPEHCRRIRLESPLLGAGDVQALRSLRSRGFRAGTLGTSFPLERSLAAALDGLCETAARRVAEGCELLILTDRDAGEHCLAVPGLLAASAVHQHLIREGLRGRCALIVEAADVCTVHHLCTLLGYGADAVYPYLGLASAAATTADGIEPGKATSHYVQALENGLRKVMAKMGIATLESYKGAQLFEALGLDGDLVDRHFTGTASRLGGAGLPELDADLRELHREAYGEGPADAIFLPVGGMHYWRRNGEHHDWNPDTLGLLQAAARQDNEAIYREFSARLNDPNHPPSALRGMLELLPAGRPVPLSEVESVEAITRRFFSGAMSLGALSPEAHETLAIGMNRVGGIAHSGEGGEQPERFDTERECRNKQVASGRFGVTLEYLAQAAQLEIKIAQGAKPGEGGQLPGEKVQGLIAELRHTTPGVGLISPPPHHDIYSIEDLAQLIHDLRCASPRAEIQVKLVASAGVGTIAAGVAKAGADSILIAGESGGTGAAARTSIHSAGLPWEMGLTDAQRVLVANRLRSRVHLRADGGLKTGRDVMVAALMGAEYYGFGMGALIAIGCIMLRKCHCNTCSVGIATQDPELRKRFPGKPEHVVSYLRFVAQEVREYMASLGFRRLDDMVGRLDCLRQRATGNARADLLDLGMLLEKPPRVDAPRREGRLPRRAAEDADAELLAQLNGAPAEGGNGRLTLSIDNTCRTAGTRLGYHWLRDRDEQETAPDALRVDVSGTAGQSLGAFLPAGTDLAVCGAANDYVGKGLSGGRISIRAPADAGYPAESAATIGNVALYGATAGELYVQGGAGERFAVRNSGAVAVVEGVGHHGCEYMTGGAVVVLGPVGPNFAAGMSGGEAYLLGDDPALDSRINTAMVGVEPVTNPRDLDLVQRLLRNHLAATASRRAEELLVDWPDSAERFVKVMPRRYAAVLEAAAERGDDLRMPLPPALEELPETAAATTDADSPLRMSE
ncbi:glutamate synthase large subunit [Ectothiorhodospiraceae bacterium WFHF3C12]|nr:glutamate synthase large subunit [Ectothiorhodospiraceae bacterium WFHF3C12]